MNPPVFELLSTDPAVGAIVGVGADPAIFDAGYKPDGRSETSYIVWQVIVGVPQNYLSERPDMDYCRAQIDYYASTRPEANALRAAGVAALELEAHQVSENPEGRDPETKLYFRSTDFEFWLPR